MIRDHGQQSHTIVPLACVSNFTIVKAAHIPLVVLASGFFIVAAAAQCSREGGGAGIPCALIGVAFFCVQRVQARLGAPKYGFGVCSHAIWHLG
jgi:hypothetical protein